MFIHNVEHVVSIVFFHLDISDFVSLHLIQRYERMLAALPYIFGANVNIDIYLVNNLIDKLLSLLTWLYGGNSTNVL